MSVIIPTKQGQICKIISEHTNQAQEYIVLDDLELYGDTDYLNVVSLKELQRNANNPQNATKRVVPKKNLTVIGENLESYISSWNKKD